MQLEIAEYGKTIVDAACDIMISIELQISKL